MSFLGNRLQREGHKFIGMAGVFLFAAFLISGDAVALDAEEVFRDAARYTVKIRTRITTAFIEETKGTQFGAGFVVDAERGWIMTNAHVVGRSRSTNWCMTQ